MFRKVDDNYIGQTPAINCMKLYMKQSEKAAIDIIERSNEYGHYFITQFPFVTFCSDSYFKPRVM